VKGGMKESATVTISVLCATKLSCSISVKAWNNDPSLSKETSLPFEIEIEDFAGIDPSEMKVLEEIGRGDFGIVFKGVYNGKNVAIKTLLNQERMTPQGRIDFNNEVEVLRNNQKETIVQFIGAVFVPGQLSIVTEYCPYGSLYTAMKKYPNAFRNSVLRVKCLADASAAMFYLHNNGVIHGDLKPENLLLFSLDPRTPVVAKITGFGTNIASRMKETKDIHSLLFVAPEILKGCDTFDKSIDVYSFSLVMYFALFGLLPFEGDAIIEDESELCETIIAGDRPVIPNTCFDENIKQLMQMCWTADSSRRPSFGEIYVFLKKSLSSRFDPDDLKKETLLGRGGFGAVFKGSYRGRDVAIKEVLNQEYMTVEDVGEFKKEVEILETFHHESIVEFIGAVFIPGKLSIVMEYCPYGSLDAAMKDHHKEFEDPVLKMKTLVDASNAMAFLHACNFIHRDLKPENFLIVSLNPGLIVAKLADFGSARDVNTLRKMKMTTGVGSRLFMAPEILKGSQVYDNTVDVYSFSLVMYFVFAEKYPYADDPTIKHDWDFSNMVIGGKRPSIPDTWNPDFKKLVEKCWSGTPSKRPQFRDIHLALSKILDDIRMNHVELQKGVLSFRKKFAKLLKEMPELVSEKCIVWKRGSGSDFKQLCSLLKGNAIDANKLVLSSSSATGKIEASGAKMIADALKANTTLTELSLSGNNIQTEGAIKLTELLVSNTTLRKLNLDGNWIGEKGAVKISEALMANTTLTELSLRENNITPVGALALGKLLLASKSLTDVNLGINFIGGGGATNIIQSLFSNSMLTRLNLEDNEIGNQAAASIVDLLRINTTLTELNLRRNLFGREKKESLATLGPTVILK